MAFIETQPAYKIYPFDRGWRIISYVIKSLFNRTHTAACWWFNKGQGRVARARWQGKLVLYCAYVVMIGMALAGGFQYVPAMILIVLFVAIQPILLSLWAVVCLLAIVILAFCTLVYSRLYRIFFRCPDCHKEMDIPTFICPRCATEHTRLWPSIYGILAHRCKACNTKLPTLRLKIPGLKVIERDKLRRICPHCRVQINAGIGTGTNIHIPIIGGPSTGKSNYIVMATKDFKQLYENTYQHKITFTDSKHEQRFNESLRRLLSGLELVKTPDMIAHAYNLKIQSPKSPVPKLAYIYDIAGEVYFSSKDTQMQEYYKYIDGIIFVIDPFAIPHYAHSHQTEIHRYQSFIRPSSLDIMETYERMFQMFEESVGLRKGKRFPHPIAIVVTKVDALNLEQEIGAWAARNLRLQDPTLTEDDAIHILVRNFLCKHGLDHFVRDAEMQFSKVRYFSCSALGRMPGQFNRLPFVPVRVANPLIWLLSSTRAITAQKVVTVALGPQVMPPIAVR
ncbi:MAG TPA: hypothetical protein VK553_07240 [Candidatus Nitrosopolaris rasttigaisensis]|nr:hypothetical protein [Candidatus Nitrosopolaris rasttigaisensis]